MAVLPNHSPCSSSPKHSLFLRLFFLMIVVIVCPAWEKAYADESSSSQVALEIDDDDIPVDDEEFDDDSIPVDEEEFDEDEPETTNSSEANVPSADSSSGLSDQEASTTSIDENGVSSGIPLELIQPSGTTIGINQTIINPDSSSGSDEEATTAAVTEEHTSFSIESSSLSTSSLDQEIESPYSHTVTSPDASVVHQSQSATVGVTLPEEKTISAPIVKFVVAKEKNKKTGKVVEDIRLEDNRLKLDEYGKSAVLIDASALPASYQSSAILQLSLRYRRHCDITPEKWSSPLEGLADSADSLASHTVYQESSVKPFSSSRNLYLLQVDLCEERGGHAFSLYFSKEKNIRSMVSKFGSVASYLVAAQVAGKFVTERKNAAGEPYWIPDGDNGGFMDTLASALPAGAIFNGVGYVREELERYNFTGYDSEISACVTSSLMLAAMNILDPGFTSDTSQMFVSNAGRLYSRSAFFGEFYSCVKTTFVDRMVYGWTGSHNATDAESEKVSSTTTSMMAALFMYSYDFIDSSEMEIMERNEVQNKQGLNKLERTQLGNIVRGGAASTAYKIVDTIDQHYLRNDLELKADDSWNYYFTQLGFQVMLWAVATTTLHYTRPYETRNSAASLGQQMLNTNSIFAANIMEAITAYGFGLFDHHVSKPVSGYLADRAVSYNLTVPDSWMHKGIKVGVRFTFNAGTAYVGINAINYLGNKAKNNLFPMLDDPSQMPQLQRKYYANNRLFIDVVTGTTTNGVVLPLVLSLDEDIFTSTLR